MRQGHVASRASLDQSRNHNYRTHSPFLLTLKHGLEFKADYFATYLPITLSLPRRNYM